MFAALKIARKAVTNFTGRFLFSNYSYMVSTFFSTATIGAVSGVFMFFAAFFPYIVIVAHDAQLTFGSKFLAVSILRTITHSIRNGIKNCFFFCFVF